MSLTAVLVAEEKELVPFEEAMNVAKRKIPVKVFTCTKAASGVGTLQVQIYQPPPCRGQLLRC